MKHQIKVFLGLVIIAGLFLGFGPLRISLVGALLRNIANVNLLSQIISNEDVCPPEISQKTMADLQQAMELDPNRLDAWRTLLRAAGWADRPWIRSYLDKTISDGTISRATIHAASDNLLPQTQVMRELWKTDRCENAWGAWTLGLLEALSGEYAHAVAEYQAGLSLAMGRVPPVIIEEYYWVLARYLLSDENTTPDQELAAAKYLSMAQAQSEAVELFKKLLSAGKLSPRQSCEATRWLVWSQSNERSSPPGPSPNFISSNFPCTTIKDPLNPPSKWNPDFSVPQDDAMKVVSKHGMLIGFDLDTDVQEAGVEVIGTLYWRTNSGGIYAQDFQSPNLWPNSGNSWLPLEGFTPCLPGYVEPPWVKACASRAVTLPRGANGGQPVGLIHIDSNQGPDHFLETASVPIHKGELVITGGEWLSLGDFPSAHVSRYYLSGEPSLPYDIVLPLSDLSLGNWERKFSVAQPLSADYDFSYWLRPEVDTAGIGDFYFDNMFVFVLPEF